MHACIHACMILGAMGGGMFISTHPCVLAMILTSMSNCFNASRWTFDSNASFSGCVPECHLHLFIRCRRRNNVRQTLWITSHEFHDQLTTAVALSSRGHFKLNSQSDGASLLGSWVRRARRKRRAASSHRPQVRNKGRAVSCAHRLFINGRSF